MQTQRFVLCRKDTVELVTLCWWFEPYKRVNFLTKCLACSVDVAEKIIDAVCDATSEGSDLKIQMLPEFSNQNLVMTFDGNVLDITMK